MNRITPLIALFVAVLLAVPAALAGNVETDFFFDSATGAPLTGVESVFYVCADNNDQCVTVIEPPFFEGNSGSSNTLVVEYPTTATPTDYALYFYAPGYLPFEGVTLNGFGTGFSATFNNFLEKGQNCRAPVENFFIINSVFMNEPLQIDIRAFLDATTRSAFRDVGTPPFFVPQAFKDEYYSARTDVTLRIFDPVGTLVHEETRNLNIFMDEAQQTLFTWTPTLQGSGYRAEVSSNVVDDQCASSEQVTVSQEFTVLQERPRNQCYVVLNNLFTDNPFPEAGEPLTAFYTRISNFADSNTVKTAVPMRATYTVRRGQSDPFGQVVFQQTVTLPADDTDMPSIESFTFTPTSEGFHTIFVTGQGQSSLCSAVPNLAETLTLETFVSPPETSDVIFTVTDQGNSPVSGAAITLSGKTNTTGANGVATIQRIPPGTYTFTITHPSFKTFTGTVQVGLADVFVNVRLSASNQGPSIFLDAIDPLTLSVGSSTTIDFNEFIADPDDAKPTLVITAGSTGSIGVVINADNRVTFTAPAAPVSRTITFTVTDPSGANASDTLMVDVASGNDAPTLAGLPDITLAEDTQLLDAFNLRNFASDLETPRQALVFTVPDNDDCGVTQDLNANIDVRPRLAFNGQCVITVSVRDQGGLTATDSFTVTVTAVNDAPVIDSFNPPLKAFVGEEYTYNVQAFDIDGDVLSFSLAAAPAGMTIDPSLGIISWVPVDGQQGLHTVTVAVTDGQLADTQTYVVDVNGLNNPPVITSTPVTVALTGELYTYDVDAFDPDVGDMIIFRLDSFPDGMEINGQTGLITWTPEEPGTYLVQVTARDSFGGSDSQLYTITVSGEPVDVEDEDEERFALLFSKIRFPAGEQLAPGGTLDISVDLENDGGRDLEDVRLTVSVQDWGEQRSAGPFDLDEGDQVTRHVLLDVPEDAAGEYDVRITASNDEIAHITYRVVTIG